MSNCKECDDWICQSQKRNHDGLCVDHAKLNTDKFRTFYKK